VFHKQYNAIFLSIFLLFSSSAYAITVDITDVSNRQYFNAVLAEINNAQDSIYVAMYSMYVRPGEIGPAAKYRVNSLQQFTRAATGINSTYGLNRAAANFGQVSLNNSARNIVYLKVMIEDIERKK